MSGYAGALAQLLEGPQVLNLANAMRRALDLCCLRAKSGAELESTMPKGIGAAACRFYLQLGELRVAVTMQPVSAEEFERESPR